MDFRRNVNTRARETGTDIVPRRWQMKRLDEALFYGWAVPLDVFLILWPVLYEHLLVIGGTRRELVGFVK